MSTQLRVSKPKDFVEFRRESILQGIHQRFEEQVSLYPARAAVRAGELTYTYAELNGHANSVAESILSRCGRSLAQAAILLPNTPEMIVGMLGALKARKAYVPLDRNYPMARLRTMFDDAEASVLLTDGAHYGLAEELARNRVPVLDISRIERHADAPNPNVGCDPLDRAYILYTSGSTGRPKGIVFLHRNLLHTTMCLTNALFFCRSDRVTWLHSASFAASVVDIYCSLGNGATLYPWDPKVQGFNGMAQWLVEHKITTLQWIPSAFRQFLRTAPEGLRFQDIRMVVMASESLTANEVELFRRHFSRGSHLVNQLGTSESYNYNLHVVDHEMEIETANIPGGHPVSPDRKVVIVDEEHAEMSQGRTGEIAIQSDYMAGGYWHDEALTRSRFLRRADDAPVFLTGDLGRMEADGCLMHLGRKDFQVKVRGYRIEIAAVERILTRAPGVADCACWTAKTRAGEDQLVGYVILHSSSRFDQRAVEDYLEARLPVYMVPRTYVLLDTLPMLPSGKRDRRALPNPFSQSGPGTRTGVAGPSVVPSVEERLLEIFKDVLQVEQVTSETDFVSAGGDSLSAAVLLHRIEQCFDVDIPMGDFVESLTPARLAALVTPPPGDTIHPLRTGQSERSGFSRTAVPQRATPSVSAIGSVRPRASVGGRCDTAGKNLIILGAGQLGREVFSWATQLIASGGLFRIKGFLDNRADALEGYDYEPRVLGDVLTYPVDGNDVFVSAIGDPVARAKCCSRIEARGGQFINVIHPFANLGLHVELGVGIVMGPFASVTCDVKIGNHTAIGALSNVGHDTVLGDWCQISSHCGINGCATVGEGSFLGSHACILPGVKVGPWAFVGAGSIVVRDVAERVKVFGNPAAPIGTVSQV